MSEKRPCKERLVGTWRFVETDLRRANGERIALYGPYPNGIVIFTASGHFALINTRPGRPKFASNDSMRGTPEENKATVEGTVAYFGSYTVNEANSTYSIRIHGSSFPNYEGTEQTRPFALVGDRLTFVNPAPTIVGSAVHATLERAT
jgi:hypothetical protein